MNTTIAGKFVAGMALAALAGCVPAANSKNSNETGNVIAGGTGSPTATAGPVTTPSTDSPTATPAATATRTQYGDADTNAAASVIREYYAAINAHDYRNAYELWSGKGEASGQSFTDFANGFAETASVAVTVGTPGRVEGAAGSRYINIPVTVRSKMADGRTQEFGGEYVLRRTVVDGATEDQKAWRISSAKMKKK